MIKVVSRVPVHLWLRRGLLALSLAWTGAVLGAELLIKPASVEPPLSRSAPVPGGEELEPVLPAGPATSAGPLQPLNDAVPDSVPAPVERASSLSPATLRAMMETLDAQQKLGAGDKVLYRVIEDNDPQVSLTVSETGDLDVPYYGLVPASGKTCRQLAFEIQATLERDLYYRATVIIGLEQINRKRTLGRVYVVGQVKQTGPQEMLADEETTVSKVILRAGGFSDFANKRQVRVIRSSGEHAADARTFVVNVSDIWEKGRVESDLKLEPDDLIFVPARMFNW